MQTTFRAWLLAALRAGIRIAITLLELLAAVVIAAILVAIAIPMYGKSGVDCDNPNARQGPMIRARIAKITGDIGQIHMAIGKFELSNNRYPVSLAEARIDNVLDPWGNPYQYLVVFGRNDVGPVRKDHNLKPVNTGYDLYSMGPDGATASPFTSTLGKDDIVMASDGDYFGLACQYNGSGK